jgi:hypothetical protein
MASASANWTSGATGTSDRRQRSSTDSNGRSARAATHGQPTAKQPHQEQRNWSDIEIASKSKEEAMPSNQTPLKPNDFPVKVDDKTIKKQDGEPVAESEDAATATDVAERLNENEDRREEDNWSA